MADAAGREGSTILPRIVLILVLINLMFLATEIVINVLGAMLPI
jgi:hypothetical protein